MTIRPEALPEREKQVLRLLLSGHDAKSIGTALGISTNIVNERLRDSRRKLAVGSSKEAARMLAAVEPQAANFFGNNPIGVAQTDPFDEQIGGSRTLLQGHPLSAIAPKGLIMTTISALFVAGAALFYAASSSPAKPPEVVMTYPANGAVVPAGDFELKVTYDQPMAPGSFSSVQVSRATYPPCDGKPRQSADGRSFTIKCTAKPSGRYELWFNRPPYMNFKAKDGLISATPKKLQFRTQ